MSGAESQHKSNVSAPAKALTAGAHRAGHRPLHCEEKLRRGSGKRDALATPQWTVQE